MINGFKKTLAVLLLAIVAVLLPVTAGSAESGEAAHFDFGTNETQLTENIIIEVDNDIETSSIIITEDGKAIYQQEQELVQVTEAHSFIHEDQSYAIITYRHAGSANALYFEVVKLNGAETELIFTSDAYVNGLMEVTESGITVEYPDFAEGDVNTEPSSYATIDFSINDMSVAAGEVQSTALENEAEASTIDDETDYKYENPSFSEINRLLTEKALDNNIAPEILKAIAYQESGWQHYWETVPASVKNNCTVDNGRQLKWDGTNAKLGYDCIGIGLMQVSNHMYMDKGAEKDKYVQRLIEDIEFNIDEGIKILLDKWRYKDSTERDTGLPIIPTVNDGDAMVIENWYFAIMAYNGMLERNNPHTNAYSAYQESVIERMRNFSQVDITPFPTQILEPYHKKSNGQLRFNAANYQIPDPVHYSSQSLENGDTAYVNTRSLNLRERPNTGSNVVAGLPKGTKVTITGKYSGNNSRVNQYVWLPVRTSNGQTGWVASSYLAQEDYVDAYRLEGSNRFETGVAVANHGWHWEQPEYVVIGRGDLPIDALTGSVLAAGVDSPLLLTRNDRLTPAVEEELKRLSPRYVYILGSTQAISSNIEKQLADIVGGSNRVERLKGDLRYDTAKSVADVVASRHSVNEIFVTTGDENSSDSLAIAPVAGEGDKPILLTNSRNLSQAVRDYIREQGISKVTIIGGNVAVSQNVENQLNGIVNTVERIEGDDRFDTNIAIIEEYYTRSQLEDVFIAQGMDTADALTASPFAAKKGSPLLLTMSDRVPSAVNRFLSNRVSTSPDLYFLGGDQAISNGVRNSLLNLVK